MALASPTGCCYRTSSVAVPAIRGLHVSGRSSATRGFCSLLLPPTPRGHTAFPLAPHNAHKHQNAWKCSALGKQDGSRSGVTFSLNPIYAGIIAFYAFLLLVVRSPYLFAALTVLTVIPQNSSITSLNALVGIAYDSGFFSNFGEAVTSVHLATWLSIMCMLVSFALQ